MMDWYNKLTSSEKKLINYGALIVLLALFWALVYQPVTQAIVQKSKRLNNLQEQYQQMQSSQEILKEQKINASKFHRDLNKTFISWIDEQLEKKQLTQFVTRSEPKDNQTLIVSFESVAFDDLVQWLEPLELNFNVKISEVDVHLIDRSNGLCNARITLEENK
jgi:general secretion pathway protein M